MRTAALPLALAASIVLPACGGGTNMPEPIVQPPITVAAATPTPVPAAPPPSTTPCEDCEAPVDNNNPATKLTIRLYILTDDEGRQLSEWDPEMIGVGWHLTLDATAKDAQGRETNGDRVVRWFIDNPGLVREGGQHLHQTKLTPVAPGQIEVYAKQDGVVSNKLRFVFVP